MSGCECKPDRAQPSSVVRQAGDFHHRPNLDGSFACAGYPCRDAERFVKIARIDHKKPAELFARLGKRPVGDEALAIADLKAGRRSDRMKGRRAEILTARI